MKMMILSQNTSRQKLNTEYSCIHETNESLYVDDKIINTANGGLDSYDDRASRE